MLWKNVNYWNAFAKMEPQILRIRLAKQHIGKEHSTHMDIVGLKGQCQKGKPPLDHLLKHIKCGRPSLGSSAWLSLRLTKDRA